MCGIFGVIVRNKTGLWTDEENFIQNLLVVGAVRGDHGTGTFWVPHKNPMSLNYLKVAGNPYNLVKDEAWGNYWKDAKSSAQAFVGHHRYATRGKHTTDNAHPFIHKHITMVHNGTIHWGLSKYEKYPNVEVDSHALTIAMAEEGLQVLSDMSGAYACVWHNSEDGTINIAKNDQRPLSMVKMENGNFFFASEGPMLAWTLQRVAPTKKWTQIKLENGQHYKFKLENLGEPGVSPLPEKKSYKSHSTYQHYGSYGHSTSGSFQETKAPIKEAAEKGTSFEHSEEVDFEVVRFFRVFSHGQLRTTYLCKTSEDEACWFASVKEYRMGQKLSGKIGKPWVNRWLEDWTTVNTPWYPVDPNSVRPLDNVGLRKVKEGLYMTGQEYMDMKKHKCIDCGHEASSRQIQSDEVEIFQYAHKQYGYLCPSCTKHYSLGYKN